MLREPLEIAAVKGVYALVNRKRRYAYVAFAANLQKRSHAIAFSLAEHDRAPRKAYWPLKNLPKHPSEEYTFMVLVSPLDAHFSAAAIAEAIRGFEKKSYTIIEGNRSANGFVTFDGKRMKLKDAIKASKTKLPYGTIYRRIKRGGWTVREALGLEERT